MKKKREQQEQEKLIKNNEEPGTLRQNTIKELIVITTNKISDYEKEMDLHSMWLCTRRR